MKKLTAGCNEGNEEKLEKKIEPSERSWRRRYRVELGTELSLVPNVS